MSLSDSDLEIFWAIAAEDRLLLQIENFLINMGESTLQLTLNKLQQDAALALADDLQDPELAAHPERTDDLEGLQRMLSTVGPEKLFDVPILMQNYAPVTPDRLQILDTVEAVLAANGSEYAALYSSFLLNLKALMPQNVASEPTQQGPQTTPGLAP